MADEGNVLVFTKKDTVPNNTTLYQLDNGIIIYHTPFDRMYVKAREREFDHLMSYREVAIDGVYGNALYHRDVGIIYKAVFHHPDILSAAPVRKQYDFETVHPGAVASSHSLDPDGEEVIYRSGENPANDGIRVDLSPEQTYGLELKGIHRKKIIYLNISNISYGGFSGFIKRPMIKDVDEKTIVVEIPHIKRWKTQFFIRESSPFFYIYSSSGHFFTAHIDKKEFLPALRFGRTCLSVAGVHNGVITMLGVEGETNYEMTAHLPDGYYDKSPLFKGVQETDEQMENIAEELRETTTAMAFKLKAAEQAGQDMSAVNELQAKIAELTLEVERLKNVNDEMEVSTVEVFEENKELKQRNDKLTQQLSCALNKCDEQAKLLVHSLEEDNHAASARNKGGRKGVKGGKR